MPLTVNDYLQDPANRCRLVVIGDSQLDGNDCSATLSLYGSIKRIQLTSNRRAAFVDFECEHAPLLVARCVALSLTNPDIPIPKGASAFLPGCSYDNFLYLHNVPRELPSCALHYWYKCATIHRLDIAGDDFRNPVVVRLRNGIRADTITKYRDFECEKRMGNEDYRFSVIPHIWQLTDSSSIFIDARFKECNLVGWLTAVREERKKQERD